MGTTRQFTATGLYKDATKEDLTDQVEWSSGDQAVGILSTQDLDLILLDSVMPAIDGVEMLQLMRSLNIQLPVVFFTGHGVEDLRETVKEFDVLDILDKKSDRFQLPQRLRELHAEHERGKISPLDSRDAPRAAS